MSEAVQRRKGNFMEIELPLLNSLFDNEHVGYITYLRQSHEKRVRGRNKKKADFTDFIAFLNSTSEEVKRRNPDSNTLKLIYLHNNRISLLYRAALKYFDFDLSLWKKYFKFLLKNKQSTLLQKVINRALLLHGHISDSLYIYVVEVEIEYLSNIQKAREIYTSGLQVHKYSSNLYFEAFKCELTNLKNLIQEASGSGQERDSFDPPLDVSVAKDIFESAVQNVKSDTDLFFQMYYAAIQYHFSLDLSKEIQKFMSTTFNMDPNYWDYLALSELCETTNSYQNMNIINCLSRYNAALSILDTDEMWDKYLTTMTKILTDAGTTEIHKIDLIKESLHSAHKKNKLRPSHYIHLIYNSKGSLSLDILDWAIDAYPNDTHILEVNINFKLRDRHELVAYELFKENASKCSSTMWLIIIEYFSNKPQIWHIFNMAFGDESVCSNKVKKKLANEYLLWISKNKSLNDARNAYVLLNTTDSCDESLCKTMVTLETGQQIIDVSKIREHFTLACMQFGKTDIALWMERLYFELEYGSLELVSTTYHQALVTLNEEESDQLPEIIKEYSELNRICNP